MPSRAPKVLESREVAREGYVGVKEETLAFGAHKSKVLVVEHPGAVGILPVDSAGKVILEKQYRHALGREIFELPAGTLEKGEDPVDCARRELMEETGYVANEMVALGTVYSSPGYSQEELFLYFARVGKAGSKNLEPDERITLVKVTPAELRSMADDGRLSDSKSLAAVFRASLKGLLPA